jgi:predicted dithiol-disulfide oxidoreductase (DUF899 family)
LISTFLVKEPNKRECRSWIRPGPVRGKNGWRRAKRCDFNFDFHVAFSATDLAQPTIDYNFTALPSQGMPQDLPGLSAFAKNERGEIFHTYSTYARGGEELIGTLMLLDRAPKGRNEDEIMDWVRRHDEYDAAPNSGRCPA